ncbi:MAG: Fe-S protein assembly co-chaperone HscB [Saprospiraceae bacterium]
MSQNYFEFYGLEPAFFPDMSLMKKKYYELSRLYHPDFFSRESDEKKDEALQKSSENSVAYSTLTDYSKRVAYILNLFIDLKEEGTKAMDPDFLMEMMDFNEKLADAQIDGDQKTLDTLSEECRIFMDNLDENIRPYMDTFDQGDHTDSLLNIIKDYYFKRKYFLRFKENITNFARL